MTESSTHPAASKSPADLRYLDGLGFRHRRPRPGPLRREGHPLHRPDRRDHRAFARQRGQRGNRYRLIGTGKTHHRTGDPVEPVVENIDFRPAPLSARPDTGAPTGGENGYCRFCRTTIFRTWWLYASDQGDEISGPYGNGWRTTWTDRDSVCAVGTEQNHTLTYHEPAAD